MQNLYTYMTKRDISQFPSGCVLQIL